MDFVTIYKDNEIVKDYETIYFYDEKCNDNPPKLGYRILHIIGNGVYGVVYKAECFENQKIVALKQTYQKNANIFKEIEIMKKLKHPNIVELKHAFYTITSNGVNVHMVMEYGNIDLSCALYYITLNTTDDITEDYSNKNINVNKEKEKEKKKEKEKEKEKEKDKEERKKRDIEDETSKDLLCDEEMKNIYSSDEKKKEETNGEKKNEKGMLHVSSENKGKNTEINDEKWKDKNKDIIHNRGNSNSPSKLYVNDLNKSINNICPCHNLNEYIKKNYFSQNQIKIYLYQLIRATLYLHSLSITHRDIKPQNILIFQNDIYDTDANSSHYDQSECLVCIQNKFEKNYIMDCRNKKKNHDNSIEENLEKNSLSEKRMNNGIHTDNNNNNDNDNVLNGDCEKNRLNKKENLKNYNENNINQENDTIIANINVTKETEHLKKNEFMINKEGNNSFSPAEEFNENEKITDRNFTIKEASKNITNNEEEQKKENNESNSVEKPIQTISRGNITFKYIKLCDFNTSIKMKENFKYFSYICSRYYRAPELLFGSNYYTQAIDTWSIGCVMGELILGKPLFLGECASDQLVEIIKILGTPNDEDFLSFRSVYKDIKFPDIKPITLNKLINSNCSKDSIDLLGKLLQFNPKKRIKLYHALLHNYFDDIRNLKAFEIFDRTNKSDNKYSYSFNTNCFNFTKEELLHYTVEERKILIPLEVREKKLDEVKQYINMPIEHFDRLYPNSLYVT